MTGSSEQTDQRVHDSLADRFMDDIQATEFRIGDTEYEIKKLLPMDAFRLLEKIRPGLNDAMDSAKLESLASAVSLGKPGTRAAIGMARFMLALPPGTVKIAMDNMFPKVFWRDPNRGEAIPLAGREDEGIKNPFDFYVLIGRCFAVNFLAYFGEFRSNLGSLWTSSPQSM